MRRLILENQHSPGDIVMLTAAVRDLHRCYPGQFQTDVRTSCPELWEHNPFLTRLDSHEKGVKTVRCEAPLIDRASDAPHHALHGFIDFLNGYLGVRIQLTEFKGDIHLSAEEKGLPPPISTIMGSDAPYWLIVAGGKYDFTIKWWDSHRYQEVIDRLRGRIQFVQVGLPGHHHPRLRGVIDLRGKTRLRQLVRLIYHAQGVLCGVTGAMHMAAAIETKRKRCPSRPCVVIAGGREPIHWEAYPHHQFIHTIGALSCCAASGCWKARTVPLGDGEALDQKRHLCVNVVGSLPRCMDMISSSEVVRRIETYFQGGMVEYLRPDQAKTARRAAAMTRRNSFDSWPLSIHNVRLASEAFISLIPSYPGGFRGRGIVICAGGVEYFTNAWVCVNMLRKWGCRLPIELWHMGKGEVDARMSELMAPLGVTCMDALLTRRKHPARIPHGWGLKPYALLHCGFREPLLLDADNVPVTNLEYLFDAPEYRATGAIFWPDRAGPDVPPYVWRFCGVPYQKDPTFESGQILVDKSRCWEALSLALWYNENAEFFYRHIYGDKETFHLAFRKLNRPFAMPSTPMRPLPGTMCQHDFEGRRILQHRTRAKWTILEQNQRVPGFWFEEDCLAFLKELSRQWNGGIRRRRNVQTKRLLLSWDAKE